VNNLNIDFLSDISSKYDGIFCDIWGVLHNGLVAYENAAKALKKYRENGGKVILITNASWNKQIIVQMLENMEISRNAYDDIITSGDVTRDIIKKYKGGNIHHVGPNSDDEIFDGLGVNKSVPERAKAVVITALDDYSQTPDDYKERLALWLELKLPLICTNPDKFVEVGGEIIYCPGALADIYEQMGGKTIQAGKPFLPIYDAAFRIFKNAHGESAQNKKILAIGDSVRTDATGAARTGLDFLFITGSIHAKEVADFGENAQNEIVKMVAPSGVNMVAFQENLV